MKQKGLLEVCCGSFSDARTAYLGGADRIELNSALYLGGLTPSMAGFILAKKECPIPIVVMIRPRGGGFCYSQEEDRTMMYDAKLFLEQGADGIVFGCLTEQSDIDLEKTERFVELAHAYGKEAIFHRAFDCIVEQEKAAEKLSDAGVNRILTSGGKKTAWEGRERLKELQEQCGSRISILPGSGIRSENALKLMEYTGIGQVHSSCGGWKTDVTATAREVNYSYTPPERKNQYETVLLQQVKELKEKIRRSAP